MGSSEVLQAPWIGKNEVQLSLGALLFPLIALVFPASQLSFWSCIAFADGLCKGGLGEEKEFSRNPLKARTALRSGVGSAEGTTGSQGMWEPWFFLCTFLCKAVGQIVSISALNGPLCTLLVITYGWSFGRITDKQGHCLNKQTNFTKVGRWDK